MCVINRQQMQNNYNNNLETTFCSFDCLTLYDLVALLEQNEDNGYIIL